MRTTLSLESDAIKALQAYARHNRVTLGKAASELIRRGAHFEIAIRDRNGVPVFDVPSDFPLITAKQVKAFLEEE